MSQIQQKTQTKIKMNKNNQYIDETTFMYLHNVAIPLEKHDECLKVVNDLYQSLQNIPSAASYIDMAKMLPSWSNLQPPSEIYSRHFPIGGFKTLEKAFFFWRYLLKDEGDVSHVSKFFGNRWGFDEILFNTIAPFVNDGATIHCLSEDNYWSYIFQDGAAVLVTGIQAVHLQHTGELREAVH